MVCCFAVDAVWLYTMGSGEERESEMSEENTVILHVEGLSSEHYVEAVTGRLTSFPGVKSVNVILDKEQVVISGSELDPENYARELNQLGYSASVIS